MSRRQDYPCAVLSFVSYQPKEEAARCVFHLLYHVPCSFTSSVFTYPAAAGFYVESTNQILRRWRQKHVDEAGAEIFHLPKRDWRGTVKI